MSGEPLNVGFIGLGTMGFAMAVNLVSKLPGGSKLFVYDISLDAVNNFVAQHPDSAVAAGSAKEVTQNSATVFTMVPEGSHVRSAFLDETNGILAADQAPRTLMDCSTIDRETSLAVLEQVRKRHPQSTFFDAPVSGGQIGAEKATLTFMVGCAEDDPKWSFVEGMLSLMGTNIIACGAPSLGVTAKLTNNYCSALISLATAEAMNMGMRAGMDPRLIQRIFSKSTAQSTMCDRFNPVPGVCPDAPSSHGYEGGFKIQLMRKDFGLACQVADNVGAKLLLAEAGLKAYTEASADPRCRDLDSRVVYRFLGGDEDWEKKQN
ncbi:NAD binding domain of 6-phosphogluconate dehydrogenase-domain-containing protein [Diaporthe sp. PMI_573]|nr:NAD binding domain of 6-phosphogluconate dehydrogenase-domain-containing protein [Diaporthaceae sp. PMI_573]